MPPYKFIPWQILSARLLLPPNTCNPTTKICMTMPTCIQYALSLAAKDMPSVKFFSLRGMVSSTVQSDAYGPLCVEPHRASGYCSFSLKR